VFSAKQEIEKMGKVSELPRCPSNRGFVNAIPLGRDFFLPPVFPVFGFGLLGQVYFFGERRDSEGKDGFLFQAFFSLRL
jgi:hypothetical protein